MSAKPQSIDTVNLNAFLEKAGWGDATRTPLNADMGLRRYYLITRQNDTALLMDMSRAGILETGLPEFIKMDKFLRANNIHAPEIYYADEQCGLALIEYMGDTSFGDALKNGVDKSDIYTKATKILVQIKQATTQNDLDLPLYKDTLIWQRVPQFVDYYMPPASGKVVNQKIHDDYQAMWDEIENALPPCPMTVCLGDYHLENLMWRSGQNADDGVIDFQDAFWGGAPYDLLNLLEDARVSVPSDIKQKMKELYCANMNEEECKAFQDWYVVMSAQFHCRVIGLFIKFADEGRGKQFLPHIPRLQNYLKDEIQNPILAPLKGFIENHKISLDYTP